MKKVKYCIGIEGSEEHCGEFFVNNNTSEEEIQDIALVVHSSWEEIKDPPYGVFDYHFRCKKCHGETPHKAYIIAPDFCPCCGAKMDKIEV